nr:tRNA lysidine(34) synthetase TilS [Hoeflea prorocentri]
MKVLCVAVSGGSDSTALLHLLHQRMPSISETRLVAVTIDHALRPDSAQEAAKVAEFCKLRGIEHRIKIWTGEKPASGLQDAARNVRYELLREAALELETNAVVTAHTRDDQIETIRMRQQRAAGRGLSGMAGRVLFRRDCWIMRPFLRVRKQALRDVLTAAQIGWSEDPSNRDRRFERVRIRQAQNEPGADMELLSMVEAMADARQKDNMRLARFLSEGTRVHGDMVVELPLVPEGLSDVLQQAVAMMAALMGGRAYLPGARSQDQIARLIAGGGPPRVNLSRSVIDRRANRIFIYRERRSLPKLELAPGASAVWDGRYRIKNDYKRRTVSIGPMGDNPPRLAESLPGDVPRGVISRSARSMPGLIDPKGTPGALTGADRAESRVSCIRHFVHFDQFLPDFDRVVADECARLFGCSPYPVPPA